MKKRLILWLMLIVVLGLVSCGKNDPEATTSITQTKKSEENGGKKMDLISVDRLFEVTGLNKADYAGVDFEKFISDYEITEAEVNDLNIDRLLRDYNDSETGVNYDYLFNQTRAKREQDFYNGIVRIAIHYNVSTTVKNVLIDIKEKKKYYSSEGYILNDITPEMGVDYSEEEINKALTIIKDIDLCSWQGKTDDEQMEYAGGSLAIAVEYDDGSVFMVSYAGAIDKLAPSGYAKLTDELLK